MACSCRDKTNTIFDSTPKINPFQECFFCAIKHLSYAYALDDEYRKIAQIFMAYKHLKSKLIFNLIEDYFNGALTQEALEKTILFLHQSESHIEVYNGDSLSDNEIDALDFLSCYELYEHEIGYKAINTPYVLGVMQRVAEKVEDSLKMALRMQWKLIEANQKLHLHTFKQIFEKLTISGK